MNAMIAAIVCALLLGGPAAPIPGNQDGGLSPQQTAAIQENIRHNLEHRITNIRANTLQLLIDLRISHPEIDLRFAQLPVMHILKQDEHEGLRILAAVALYHIGDRRGRYAVQRRALYDESPRVAQQCTRLFHYWGNRMRTASSFATAGGSGTAGDSDTVATGPAPSAQ
ncbi:MAG: hypothetical protein RRA94_09865 [Bacteroidota bacterium]|nr:hypothetical protein [Bacteroidota bacterium]